jgi:hypothetical protein
LEFVPDVCDFLTSGNYSAVQLVLMDLLRTTSERMAAKDPFVLALRPAIEGLLDSPDVSVSDLAAEMLGRLPR